MGALLLDAICFFGGGVGFSRTNSPGSLATVGVRSAVLAGFACKVGSHLYVAVGWGPAQDVGGVVKRRCASHVSITGDFPVSMSFVYRGALSLGSGTGGSTYP